MTKKIFKSIFEASVCVLLASLVIIFGIMYGYLERQQEKQLELALSITAAGIESGGQHYLDKLNTEDYRITWINSDGNVIYDSQAEASRMENHLERQEIKDALLFGEGESIRYSSTLTEKTMYTAILLSDNTILRVSQSYATILTLMLTVISPVAVVFAAAFILSLILANRISKRIVAPLDALDLENPLENDTYEELSPILNKLEKQYKKIQIMENELENKRKEFFAVIRDMKEGLVLLSSYGAVLSINPVAKDFFAVDYDCIGMDFFAVERNSAVSKAINEAKADGNSSLEIEKNDRTYRLNMSLISSDENASGIVILIFDVTDKILAERSRREFTANVSHELKTPLQSIMGSAELIENGFVKNEDIARFAHNIRKESERLKTLINDIIRLSQLDEKQELEFEPIDLYNFIKDEIENINEIAERKNVKISFEGKSLNINTVKQLMHEIIYNLLDNAIKYNKQDGNISVKIRQTGDYAEIEVADTGIGIAKEDIERIFERFYRADKSHSKEIEGTGLGLSIVKHAAGYLGGEIQTQSIVGEGTKITVKIKV